MQESDRDQFARTWIAAWQLYGKDVTPDMLSLSFGLLKCYSLDEVNAAIIRHMQASKFPPVPADVIAILTPRPEADGRPTAEIAWAMYPRSEAETVTWTEEMAVAFGVASPIDDDPIAARMAFKEAYVAEVAKARAEGRPAKWSLSLGHDAAGREGPIMDAVRLGRISAQHACKFLPHLSEKLAQLESDSRGQQRIASMVKEIA